MVLKQHLSRLARPRSIVLLVVLTMATVNCWYNRDVLRVRKAHNLRRVRTNNTTKNSPGNNTSDFVSQKRKRSPRIVWLLSFPNSGTSYTLKFIQAATQTTTATNYGGTEQVGYANSLSVDPNYPQGPFFRYPERPHPTDFILTKTHCDSHDIVNQTQFEITCRKGNVKVNGTVLPTIYDVNQIGGAVHLIRNPFDNAVARMHYRQKVWAESKNKRDQQMAQLFSSTPHGFARWCQYLAVAESPKRKRYHHFQQSNNNGTTYFWKEYLEPVPCYMEFYRYFHWHNRAVETVDHLNQGNKKSSSLVLYYESYTTNNTATTDRLLAFLHLNRTTTTLDPLNKDNHTNNNSSIHFVPGKTYPDFFSPDHVQAVRKLAVALCSEAAWSLLRHYF